VVLYPDKSYRLYNPAAAGSTLDSLVISAGHASTATGGVDPQSIPPPGVILLIAGPSPSGMSAALYTFIHSLIASLMTTRPDVWPSGH
jgi:hypothetical protein